ncbi:MAG: phosphoenolpyruvate carboxykinase (ATP) [Anaerolineales bacterium]|nr:phosphoenolpyruvate carboxykinase (ATP) [Anaerolineales bacterium]
MTKIKKTPSEDQAEDRKSDFGLEYLDLVGHRKAYWNLTTDEYYQESLSRNEGVQTPQGALVVRSGERTARSANDKFIVKEDGSAEDISWGEYNIPFREEDFNRIFDKMRQYLVGKDIFIQDGIAGASPQHQIPVRVISTWAWLGLFTKNMFISPEKQTEWESHQPEFTVISLPDFAGDPLVDHLNSPTFILLNFKKRLVLIGNTGYGGEVKKSIFTALNYYLPKKEVLTMHCSANVGLRGDSALYFGLSGTGKTTLSADPERKLIGDDEHGWDEEGIFNFEDGSYAKVIDLSQEAEPDIYATTQTYGTILENVIIDPDTGTLDLFDDSITKNTRASYPLKYIPYSLPSKRAGHPENIIFLTFDANGVMPPIAKLNHNQALYHFISGYTSKVGGTESGVGEAPELTFSACFGAPFMVFHPAYYAELLKRNLVKYNVKTWLINTGLVGGPAGVGSRISIHHTRALLSAVLNGDLDQVPYLTDPWFGFEIPENCPGVPDEILNPSAMWPDKGSYERSISQLVLQFNTNMEKYQDSTPVEVLQAGPAPLL